MRHPRFYDKVLTQFNVKIQQEKNLTRFWCIRQDAYNLLLQVSRLIRRTGNFLQLIVLSVKLGLC